MVTTTQKQIIASKYKPIGNGGPMEYSQMSDIVVPFQLLTPDPTKPVESQIEPVLFALCVGAEARGEPIEGIALVCDVILNRARLAGSRYGASVREVILKNHLGKVYQFSSMNPLQSGYKWMKNPDPMSYCKVGKIAFLKYFGLFPVESKNVYHYFADYIDPPQWANKATIYKRVGKHIFLNGAL